MTKTIDKHEEKYIHIPKTVFVLITFPIWYPVWVAWLIVISLGVICMVAIFAPLIYVLGGEKGRKDVKKNISNGWKLRHIEKLVE